MQFKSMIFILSIFFSAQSFAATHLVYQIEGKNYEFQEGRYKVNFGLARAWGSVVFIDDDLRGYATEPQGGPSFEEYVKIPNLTFDTQKKLVQYNDGARQVVCGVVADDEENTVVPTGKCSFYVKRVLDIRDDGFDDVKAVVINNVYFTTDNLKASKKRTRK